MNNHDKIKVFNIPVIKSIRNKDILDSDNISGYDPTPLTIDEEKGINSMAVIHLNKLNNFMNISLDPRCNSITIQLKTSFFDGDEILVVDKSNTVIVGVATLKEDGKTILLKHQHNNLELAMPLADLKFMAIVRMSSMNPYI